MKNSHNIITLTKSTKTTLRKFLKMLVLNLNSKNRFIEELKRTQYQSHMTMGRNGKGITLVGEEVEKYRKLLEILFKVYPHSENYGKSYAEDTLKDAIWEALESSKEVNEACKDSVELIEKKYTIQLTSWDVYFPVSGIDFQKRTTWKFGSTSFIKITNRNFKKTLSASGYLNLILSNEETVNCFMQIKVMAADFYSAIKIGKPIADLHIAILNALSNIAGSSKHNSTHSSYMGNGEQVHSYVFAGQDKRFGWSRCISFNLAGFNPHVLRGSQFIKGFSIKRISKELRIGKNDLFQKRLLPALKWTGKAICQNTNEEVFLYYCLAFESIIFEQEFVEGVMDGLRKRTYRLFFSKGHWLGSSIDSYNKLNYLYKIRSDIVHRGGTEVSDDDILLIRNLAEGALFKLLYDKSLYKLKTSAQFDEWLNK